MPALLCPDLIGRSDELETLRDLLRAAAEGPGGFVLISGEAGVGKSRFVANGIQEFADLAHVSAGNCLNELRLLPYAPLAEALRGLIRSEPPAPDPYLRYLLPELDPTGDPLGPEALDSGAVRHRIGQAVCNVLETMAKDRPVVMVLEDLQWSDAATRELLPLLVKRAVADGVVIVGTFRSDEDLEYFESLSDLARRGGHTHISLAPISEADVGRMIGSIFDVPGPVSGDFMRAMHERTDGNPLFVEELVTTLMQTGVIFRRGGVWDRKALDGLEVPSTIRETILRRIRGLPDDLLQTLRVASVIGERDDLPTLARACRQEADETIEKVRALIDERLLVEDDDRIRFRHALTRDTVYGELLSVERSQLHRQVAKTLEAMYEDNLESNAAQLAHHYSAAGDRGQALRFSLLAAAHAESVGSLHDARSHVSTARQLTDDESERAGLLRRLGNLAFLAGRMPVAIAELSESASSFERLGDTNSRAGALLDLAIATLMDGRNDDALRLRYEALELLEPLGESVELAWAYRGLGHHYMLASAHARAQIWSQKAIDLGERLGAGEVVAEARTDFGSSSMLSGDMESGFQMLRAVIKEARERGWVKVAGRAHINLTNGLVASDRYEETIEIGWAGVHYCRAVGNEFAERLCQINLASCLRWIGSWGEAEALLQELMMRADETGTNKYRLVALCELTPLRADQGRWEEAEALLAEVWPLAEVRNELQQLAPVRTAAARVAIAAGDRARAWTELETLRDYWSEKTDDATHIGLALYLAVELASREGDRERASEWLDILEDVAGRSPSAHVRVLLNEARGHLAAAEGSPEDERWFREAVEGWSELGRPFDRGRALRLLGEAQPDRGAAIESLKEAATIFGELGAGHELKLAHTALRQAGAPIPRGPRPSTRTAPGGLTERELEVARLVAEGRTNADIAHVLVISKKTAATHVGHILSKLGFSSRAQIARWVATQEHALAGAPR